MSTSFQDFIQQVAVTSHYPLNTIAQSYLQDWYAGQAVAVLDGGMAFEAQLHKLDLDGSIASLGHLDKFLDAVKPHLAHNYLSLTHDKAQTNLLTFIAFYVGMVWAYQVKFTPYWTTYAHLTQQYPALTKAIDDDFSYSLVISQKPISETVNNQALIMLGLSETLFFPLVTIIERLYPRRQDPNQTQAPFFGYITDSLESSVTQLLIAKPSLPAQANPKEFLASQNQGQIQFIQSLPKISLSKILGLSDDFLLSDKSVIVGFEEDGFETVRTDYQYPFLDETPKQAVTEKHSPVTATEQTEHTVVSPVITLVTDISQAVASDLPVRDKKTKDIAFTAKQTAENNRALKQEKQQKEQEKKRLEQEQQQKIAEALANPQYHEGLLNQRKSIIDQKRAEKAIDTFSELEKSLKLSQAPSQKITENEANDPLVQAEQKANAILASEQRKAQRLSKEKLSGKLLQDISKVNQLTEVGKPKALDSFDILLPETVTAKANPDSTGNAEVDEQYFQTCQMLSNLQAQDKPDANLVRQTLSNLQQLAKSQHSGAMLQLALLRFRGEASFNIAKDAAQALKLVQASAKLNDHRAEKLLSKLYFSGQGVPLSTELGNYWLEQSASHGNVEAKELLASMAIAQELRHVQQNDNIYQERLLMGVVALLIFALAIIFLIKT